LKYTVSYSGKIVVEGVAVREIFLSREFDETTPLEIGYGQVRDQVEEWIVEQQRLKPAQKRGDPKPDAVPETTSPFTGEPAPKPEKPKVAFSMEDATKAFPQNLAGMLYFESTDEYVLVKPRQYLGGENFREISSIVRDHLGGEYVSAGKESGFRIPRKKEPPKTIGFAPAIPEFNPEDVMEHDWKGRKSDGGYNLGNLSWGWDFSDNFSEATIKTLEKGPLDIDKYRFTLDKERNTVNVRKVEA